MANSTVNPADYGLTIAGDYTIGEYALGYLPINGNGLHISGSEASDNFAVVGDNNTVETYGGNDTIQGNGTVDKGNVVFAGDGDDKIGTSHATTIYAGNGNDVIDAVYENSFVDAGPGNDNIKIYWSAKNTTLTGGAGQDLFYIPLAKGSSTISDYNSSIIITDLSNEDSLQEEYYPSYSQYVTPVTYSYENGSTVLRSEGDTPNSVTLLGVTDINQVANVKYRRYTGSSYFNPQLEMNSTLGEIVTPAQNLDSVNNENEKVTREGVIVIQHTITLENSFTGNLWLNGLDFFSGQKMSYSFQDSLIISIDASNISNSRIITGNSQNNFITASSGGSSLWGGGSGTFNTFKTGAGHDMIFWINEHDEVQNFSMGRSGDILNLQTMSLTSYNRDSASMSFNATDGSSIRIQNSSSSDEVVGYTTDGVNTNYAKIGRSNESNSFTYEDDVTFYSGGSQVDVLNVATQQSKNIALDGSQGVYYDNINNINASGATGSNQLYGNGTSNQIIAGQGNDSLWGGNGNSANDTLIAGSGDNTFRYGVNEGNDIVVNSVATDKIDLYNVSLTDIASANEIGSDFVIQMAGGQSLTIQGQNGASNFILSDRSAYNYNRSTHSWSKIN